jgi:uncharacterized repeat protein (TIGR03833 family)
MGSSGGLYPKCLFLWILSYAALTENDFNTCSVLYPSTMSDGRKRANIKPGIKVRIVEKQNQKSGKLTEGIVDKILTSSVEHPHGIKVQLKEGAVGRVAEIIEGSHASSKTT